MACSEYMQMIPDAMPLKVYGFRKVSKTELEDIVQRLQRPTHSQETQMTAGSLWQSSCIPPRAPFTHCRRSPSPQTGASKAPMSGRAMQKVVRRLQRPTISTMAAEGTIAPNYELEFGGKLRAQTPKTPEDQEKLLERIQRPTTASRRKLFGHTQCILCEDLVRSSVHETMRRVLSNEGAGRARARRRPATTTPLTGGATDDTASGPQASRSRSATHASGGGKTPCPRVPANQSPPRLRVTSPSELPLISGLARSDKVNDITERLHPASHPGMTSRPTSITRAPSATPIVVSG